MTIYLNSIKQALIMYPFLALMLTVPFLIFQYRKYGYVNKFRAFILCSFTLYLLIAFSLVIFPLPKNDTQVLKNTYQLIPFNFVLDFIKETKVNILVPSTYINIIKERGFYQVFFNVLLLVPLGIYLRYYFNKSLKATIIITFLISLFFELTQLSGLYGIYKPYRLFDVDDLMVNTVGGLIGYKISSFITCFLPNTLELDKDIQLESIKVSYIRRYLAFSCDFMIISTFSSIFFDLFIFHFLIFMGYFVICMNKTNGMTLGKWIFRIKVKGKNDILSQSEIFKRYLLIYITFFVTKMFPPLVIIIFAYLFISIFKSDRRLFHEKLSNTKVVVC